jgi:hypothetical protein
MSLHARAAKALGWSESDVRSVSLQSLRDLVRPVDPKLAADIGDAIASRSYYREPPRERRRRRR